MILDYPPRIILLLFSLAVVPVLVMLTFLRTYQSSLMPSLERHEVLRCTQPFSLTIEISYWRRLSIYFLSSFSSI